MKIPPGTLVTLPGFHPYPRYGWVRAAHEDGSVEVGGVHCGDPRCAAEHAHGPARWNAAEIEAATAYQPRAPWEHGRKGAPNAFVS